MIVVEDNSISIIYVSIIVFSIVLILTKSKILAWKREFVEQRYKSAKVGGLDPGWVHRWWHSLWLIFIVWIG